MMEQFDGIRVFWDGNTLTVTKTSQKIQVPKDLKFPHTPFEGELWFDVLCNTSYVS
jgi:hypothetical protein